MDEEFGLAVFDVQSADGAFGQELRGRIRSILAEQFERAKQFLTEHRQQLEKLAQALLEKNHLKGEEVEKIVRQRLIGTPGKYISHQEGKSWKNKTPGKEGQRQYSRNSARLWTRSTGSMKRTKAI